MRFVLLILAALFVGVGLAFAPITQAQPPTATPARLSLPTPGATATPELLVSPTPTHTPTPEGIILLQARDGDVNVRAEPDPDSTRLGAIRPGELYPVRGRYFRWLQFEYPQSPNGLGWVYDELVDIVGDASLIPDLNADTQPTPNTAGLVATQTIEALALIPGGLLTATADARRLPVPGSSALSVPGAGGITPAGPDAAVTQGASSIVVLPTFTYPPNVVAQAPTPAVNNDDSGVAATSDPLAGLPISVSDGLPPIVPILALAGLGLLGFAFSGLLNRR